MGRASNFKKSRLHNFGNARSLKLTSTDPVSCMTITGMCEEPLNDSWPLPLNCTPLNEDNLIQRVSDIRRTLPESARKRLGQTLTAFTPRRICRAAEFIQGVLQRSPQMSLSSRTLAIESACQNAPMPALLNAACNISMHADEPALGKDVMMSMDPHPLVLEEDPVEQAHAFHALFLLHSAVSLYSLLLVIPIT
jgi:hypothetical protein